MRADEGIKRGSVYNRRFRALRCRTRRHWPSFMKKMLLLVLLIVLPWQAFAAAERSLAHVLSGQASSDFQYVGKHIAEHDAHVLHHHDDDDNDGEAHVDNSDKSVQHLNDFEHGCGAPVLLPASPVMSAIIAPRLAPHSWPETFSDRSVLPPLPPPRTRA